MSATNFKTENNTYRKLIGNGLTYRIPRFQRDYSWGDEEWEDLWADILDTISDDGEPAHYMGYLVLQSQDDKCFDVIDGQQRLTTLSLIVLAVLSNLKQLIDKQYQPSQNQQRLEQIRSTYIGYLDPITLVTQSKLTLNRHNDHYYQSYLVPLEKLPKRGFRVSEHNLRKAFEYYEKQVHNYMHQQPGDLGVTLARLVETMSDRLFFTVISVTDELNAYKVFETLNARGVRLSSTDLLKNYLFSVLHKQPQHEQFMQTLEDRWERMVSRLGAESFPDFLRSHWNSRHKFVRASDLFKTIRHQITDPKAVFESLREMDEDLDNYLALIAPEASQWPSDLKTSAQQLRMFRVRQPFPLILAAARRLSLEQLTKIVRGCVVIALRYNVIGSQPANEQERVYHRAAQQLNQADTANDNTVLLSLNDIYPKDNEFRAAFSNKIIRTQDARNNRLVRYILCELERQFSQTHHDFESAMFNLEHILPQNPGHGWEQFSEKELEALTYRIGNMVLLAKGANKDLGNADYVAKRAVYQTSQFGLTRRVAEENDFWNASRIEARQAGLAKLATTVWRIEPLS